MDRIDFQHQDLAAGRWAEMPFSKQMGNIGSEVSRALKSQRKGRLERAEKAFFRALELMDLTIDAARNEGVRSRAKVRELCRAREELCDYFSGENQFMTNPENLCRYYDQFALVSNSHQSVDQT